MSNKTKLKKYLIISLIAALCILFLFSVLNIIEYRVYTKYFNQKLNDIVATVTEKYPDVSQKYRFVKKEIKMSFWDTNAGYDAIDRLDMRLSKISDSLEVIAGCLSEQRTEKEAKANENKNADDRDHILHAFQAYVEEDYEGTEISYIRDMLKDTCGLTDEEVEKYGFGWVLDN